LIILGTNDPYWTLDSLNLYWDQLSGDKYCLYVPNKGHGIEDFPRVVGGIVAFHRAAVGELTLPKLKWEYTNGDGKLSLALSCDVPEERVVVWTARSASKDFRQAEWTSREIRDAKGRYFHDLEVPKNGDGYAAMFAEAAFDGGELPYYLSTNVRIVGGEK
jgi:PhoPQ-activated pathogenicity-related protein